MQDGQALLKPIASGCQVTASKGHIPEVDQRPRRAGPIAQLAAERQRLGELVVRRRVAPQLVVRQPSVAQRLADEPRVAGLAAQREALLAPGDCARMVALQPRDHPETDERGSDTKRMPKATHRAKLTREHVFGAHVVALVHPDPRQHVPGHPDRPFVFELLGNRQPLQGIRLHRGVVALKIRGEADSMQRLHPGCRPPHTGVV